MPAASVTSVGERRPARRSVAAVHRVAALCVEHLMCSLLPAE